MISWDFSWFTNDFSWFTNDFSWFSWFPNDFSWFTYDSDDSQMISYDSHDSRMISYDSRVIQMILKWFLPWGKYPLIVGYLILSIHKICYYFTSYFSWLPSFVDKKLTSVVHQLKLKVNHWYFSSPSLITTEQ